MEAARAWRQESQVALRRGQLRAPSQLTLREAATTWLAEAERGIVRTRSGDRYKPSAIRSYRQALNRHVLPNLGGKRITAITHVTMQDLADELVAAGLAASTVRNAFLPLRAIYKRALARDIVALNPTLKLALPAVRGTRDRVARPDEAAKLINALPLAEQALWATALYAGLRLGELQALTWNQIDFANNLLHVERSWDRIAGYIPPKSRSATRRVPLTPTLRTYLRRHRLQQRTTGDRIVFPNTTGDRPFNPATAGKTAQRHWNSAGLQRITLHECRHTYASYMIAAGVNTKALSTYMGHASITITLDRYGHLLPGNEHEAADLLDAWLERSARSGAEPIIKTLAERRSH